MKKSLVVLVFALLWFVPIGAEAQDPTPAPAGTLLVTRTCAAGYVKSSGRSRSQYNMSDGIQPIFGDQLACNGDFGEPQLLVPGEFRLFMHLIGPTEEYDLTCLGHIKWHESGDTFELDKSCVIPNGKHGYWLWEHSGLAGPNTPGAIPGLPADLTYIPANLNGDKLTVVFAHDYHNAKGTSIVYTVLHRMGSHGRIMGPGEAVPSRYVCPNGEVTVAGKNMCRPEN